MESACAEGAEAERKSCWGEGLRGSQAADTVGVVRGSASLKALRGAVQGGYILHPYWIMQLTAVSRGFIDGKISDFRWKREEALGFVFFDGEVLSLAM